METHLDITLIEAGTYDVVASEGQVATRHKVAVDQDYLEQTGIDGADLVREVCEILLQHEALAGIPAESTIEQLVAHFPYLSTELHERLSVETPGVQRVEPARITPVPAEDHPTHT